MNSHQCFCGYYFGGPYFSGLLFTEKVNRSECNIDCQGDPELKCGALTTRFEDYYTTRTWTIISLYRQGIVIFYTEILTGKFVLWCFFMSGTSEKIHNSTFQVKISV